MDPSKPPSPAFSEIELVIEPRQGDLGGGFTVERLLPAMTRRLVGPFVFLDHMGPAELRPPAALDVRPHPHIGLATVTFLYEGEILHRDSLGSAQAIRPGAVNWMTAGRGIVHSERTPPELRGRPSPIHGVQLWVALPRRNAEIEPAFHHHRAEALPLLEEGGAALRLLAGSAFGAAAPARTWCPLFLADVRLRAGARVPFPPTGEHAERAVYVVDGTLEGGGGRVEAGRLAVLSGRAEPRLVAAGPTRVLLLGGAPFGERLHLFWNFVAHDRERIEEAKRAWREGRFPLVPGDEHERVELPGEPPRVSG